MELSKCSDSQILSAPKHEIFDFAWAEDDEQQVESMLTNFMTWASLTRDMEMQKEQNMEMQKEQKEGELLCFRLVLLHFDRFQGVSFCSGSSAGFCRDGKKLHYGFILFYLFYSNISILFSLPPS